MKETTLAMPLILTAAAVVAAGLFVYLRRKNLEIGVIQNK